MKQNRFFWGEAIALHYGSWNAYFVNDFSYDNGQSSEGFYSNSLSGEAYDQMLMLHIKE